MKKSWIAVLIAFVALVLVFVFANTCANNVEVSFDSLGGTKVETIKVKKDSTITKPEDPTKEGYTFISWMLDGEEFDFSTKITKNIKLTAKWKEDTSVTYTIKFDSNGGNKIDSIEVKSGKITSLPIPEREGYTFVGWFNGTKEIENGDTISKDITLKAKWKKLADASKKEFIVTFDTDGGSKVSKQTISENGKVKKPANPTKNGYTFISWTLNSKTYNFNQKVTSNITLKATWKKNATEVIEEKEYTISFDTDGGSAVNSQKIKENSKVTKPSDPTKDKYKFLGWYLDDELYSFDAKITKDITLKAKWEYVPTVTYKVEELTGSIVGQAKVFILKDDVKTAGYADITTSSGTKSVSIPLEGFDINKNKIIKIENIKLNN